MSAYDRGDLIRLDAIFAVDGVATDPSSVVVRVKTPDGTVTTPAPARDGTGAYHIDVDVTASGTYHYRWEGTGAAQAAEEATFDVRPSAFV